MTNTCRLPVLRFHVLGRSFEIYGLKSGRQMTRVVYLGDGHTMAVNGAGVFYSTRVQQNAAYSVDAKSAAPYVVGIAALGGLNRKQAAEYKRQAETENRRKNEGYLAHTIIEAVAELSKVQGIALTKDQARLLKRLHKFY